MRTVVFAGPERVEMRDIPVPMIRAGDVLVRTSVTSISPGTELLVLTGRLPLIQQGQIVYPLVPGYENCGQIVEVGAGVQGLAAGDWVFVEGNPRLEGITSCWGGHSEYVSVPADEAFKVPAGVTPEEATFTCLASVALHGVQRGQVGIGDSVAIFGQGAVGLLALQAARLAGAVRVIAVDLLDHRLELARELGATETINAAREDAVARIRALTGGAGCRVVVEVTGSETVVTRAPQACAEHGRLVLLGMYSAPVTFDYWDLYLRELDVVSSRGAGPKVWSLPSAGWTWAHTYQESLRLIAGGHIRVAPLISHRFPVEDIRQAYGALQHRPARTLKVMLQW